MPTDLQTRSGLCPSHGAVEATREMPQVGFPFVVYGVRRLLSRRRPFRCPTCGEPVRLD